MAQARIRMYRSNQFSQTLCPTCFKRGGDPTFQPIRADDPSLREGVEVCSDCGKTLKATKDRL